MTEPKHQHLTIALVGRPNVGKSTLFNRLVGRRQAIVDDTPGTTVDRHYGRARIGSNVYTVIDTGGFEPEPDGDLLSNMHRHSLMAIEEADIVFMLFDGRDGLTVSDEEIVDALRKCHKPVYYLVNKIDGPRHESLAADFYSLGATPLFTVSAEHGVGIGDLLAEVESDYPSVSLDEDRDPDELRIAVVGKPNVGKSTLVNRFIGEERHIVTDVPGTTRDAIDSVILRGEKKYRLIDTAGIRRQRSVSQVMEKRTIVKALKALDRADCALLMIDAREGVTEQDSKIAGFAHDKGLASVIVVNKWDLIEKDTYTSGQMVETIRDSLKFLSYAPVIFISALTGQRAEKILQIIEKAVEQHRRRLGTGELNRWLEKTLNRRAEPTHHGKALKIFYITQVEVSPPTFMVVVNEPDRIHFSYERFLVNRLREDFGFEGTPIKVFYRKRSKRNLAPPEDSSPVSKKPKKNRRLDDNEEDVSI